MVAKATLDRAGRVVISKPLRRKLRLEPGDSVHLERHAEAITVRPDRATVQLQKERGVWVLRTGRPLSPSVTDHVNRRLRDES